MHRYRENGTVMDKMKCPCVSWYPESFEAGTRLMTNEETGIYVHALNHQFIENGISQEEYDTVPPAVKRKFKKRGKKYFNDRMLLETKKKQEYSKSRANNRRRKEPKPLEERLKEAGVINK